MRLVRDTMFETMIGISELPDARLYSVIVTVPLVYLIPFLSFFCSFFCQRYGSMESPLIISLDIT